MRKEENRQPLIICTGVRLREDIHKTTGIKIPLFLKLKGKKHVLERFNKKRRDALL